MEENVSVQTSFPSKLLVTKRTLEGVSEAFMDDSHVARQTLLVLVRIFTLRTGKVNLPLTFDPLVHVFLVCFQTVEIGKVTPADLAGDDYSALVNTAHVELVEIGLDKLLATDLTGVFVLGLTLVCDSDVCIEVCFGSEHLATVITLE